MTTTTTTTRANAGKTLIITSDVTVSGTLLVSLPVAAPAVNRQSKSQQ